MTVPWTEGCRCGVNKDKETCTNILDNGRRNVDVLLLKADVMLHVAAKIAQTPTDQGLIKRRTRHLLIEKVAKKGRNLTNKGERPRT